MKTEDLSELYKKIATLFYLQGFHLLLYNQPIFIENFVKHNGFILLENNSIEPLICIEENDKFEELKELVNNELSNLNGKQLMNKISFCFRSLKSNEIISHNEIASYCKLYLPQ